MFLIDVFVIIAGKHNFPLVEMQFCAGSLSVAAGKQDWFLCKYNRKNFQSNGLVLQTHLETTPRTFRIRFLQKMSDIKE